MFAGEFHQVVYITVLYCIYCTAYGPWLEIRLWRKKTCVYTVCDQTYSKGGHISSVLEYPCQGLNWQLLLYSFGVNKDRCRDVNVAGEKGDQSVQGNFG
jgi:hypothetical protein